MVQRSVATPEEVPDMVIGEVGLEGVLMEMPAAPPVHKPVSLVPGAFPANETMAPGHTVTSDPAKAVDKGFTVTATSW